MYVGCSVIEMENAAQGQKPKRKNLHHHERDIWSCPGIIITGKQLYNTQRKNGKNQDREERRTKPNERESKMERILQKYRCIQVFMRNSKVREYIKLATGNKVTK